MKNLADAAEQLAQKDKLMKGYEDFQDKRKYWFYSPNNHLNGATSKPSFSSWKDWTRLSQNQKRYLIEQAGLNERSISSKDEEKLLKAHKAWPAEYSVVYWGGGDDNYTCNIFVGDSLFYAGKTIFGKYHSAKAFYDGQVPDFKLVDKKEGVQRGDVAAFGGTHLEIVTSVTKEEPWFGDPYYSFCSRGAGRGGSDQGTEKCGGAWFNQDRYVEEENIRFYRLVR